MRSRLVAHAIGEPSVRDEHRDAAMASADRIEVRERIAEPLAKQAAPHRRAGPLHDLDERSFAPAAADGALDLEASQRDRVDLEPIAIALDLGRFEMRECRGSASAESLSAADISAT